METKNIRKLYTILLIFMPILNQYQIPILKPIEIFSFLACIYYLMDNRKIKLDSIYDLFVLYGFIVSIISTFLLAIFNYEFEYSIANHILRMVKYFVVFLGIIVAARKYFDFDLGIKWYGYIVVLCSVTIIIQYIIYVGTGKAFFGILPNVILNYENGMSSNNFINLSLSRLSIGFPYRPTAFFIEPAHFATYALPWLILEIFSPRMKNKTFPFITILAIFLTSSSLGMIGVMFILIYYLFNLIKSGKISKRIIRYMPIVILAVGIIIMVVVNSDGFWFSVRTKLNSLQNLSEASSVSYRLLRGLIYYKNIGTLYQLIGLGYGNLEAYYHAVNMNLSIDAESNLIQVAYMNGMQEILNMYGIIGLVIFLHWITSFIKKRNSGKLLGLVFIVILLGADYYDTANYIVLVVLLLCSRSEAFIKKNDEENL